MRYITQKLVSFFVQLIDFSLSLFDKRDSGTDFFGVDVTIVIVGDQEDHHREVDHGLEELDGL